MSNFGFAQLRALQAQLNRLIDAAEGVSFAGLDEPRDVDEPLAPQDARLAPVSSTLAQMSALVGGPRTILTHALSVRVFLIFLFPLFLEETERSIFLSQSSMCRAV